MKYTFQHYLDISTSASSMQLIKIKAGGEYVRERCKHLFGTYKYWKLGKIEAKLIPASTLPVSPSGLAYAPGDEWQVDPRDQLNPGLVRITNGEDILDDFSGLSTAIQEEIYKNTMLDPRWSKFMLQSGFRRKAVPLAWNVGNLQQAVYPDSYNNIPSTAVNGNKPYPYTSTAEMSFLKHSDQSNNNVTVEGYSNGRGLFQTGHHQRLGWLPTDAFEVFMAKGTDTIYTGDAPLLTPIPEIDCITLILPKAYKTLYYYRLFITETVYFSGIKNVGIASEVISGEYSEYRSVDNFTKIGYPQPAKPGDGVVDTKPNPLKPNDGSGSI